MIEDTNPVGYLGNTYVGAIFAVVYIGVYAYFAASFTFYWRLAFVALFILGNFYTDCSYGFLLSVGFLILYSRTSRRLRLY